MRTKVGRWGAMLGVVLGATACTGHRTADTMSLRPPSPDRGTWGYYTGQAPDTGSLASDWGRRSEQWREPWRLPAGTTHRGYADFAPRGASYRAAEAPGDVRMPRPDARARSLHQAYRRPWTDRRYGASYQMSRYGKVQEYQGHRHLPPPDQGNMWSLPDRFLGRGPAGRAEPFREPPGREEPTRDLEPSRPGDAPAPLRTAWEPRGARRPAGPRERDPWLEAVAPRLEGSAARWRADFVANRDGGRSRVAPDRASAVAPQTGQGRPWPAPTNQLRGADRARMGKDWARAWRQALMGNPRDTRANAVPAAIEY